MSGQRKIRRRELLAAAVGGVVIARGASFATDRKRLLDRSLNNRHWPVSNVSIVKAPAYDMDVYDTVYRIVAEHVAGDGSRHHGLDIRGKRIVLKPNLVEFDPNTVINTHPTMVHAAYEAFRRLGAAQIRIAEGPGHRRGTLDLADAAGYFSTVPKFEDNFTDLNLDNVAKRQIPEPLSGLKALYLPHTILDCDLLVSLPKMKTHHWAGATLSMKNLFGVVPGGIYGWPKNVLHWAGIPETIVDLHNLFPRQFAIVDGIDGMEGNGPIQGTPKHAGVIVAGSDVAAVDATCCRIMGIDPKKIEYLKLARGDNNLGEVSFRQIGEKISSVRSNFELVEEWRQVRLA